MKILKILFSILLFVISPSCTNDDNEQEETLMDNAVVMEKNNYYISMANTKTLFLLLIDKK